MSTQSMNLTHFMEITNMTQPHGTYRTEQQLTKNRLNISLNKRLELITN